MRFCDLLNWKKSYQGTNKCADVKLALSLNNYNKYYIVGENDKLKLHVLVRLINIFPFFSSDNEPLHNRHDDTMKEIMCSLAQGTVFPK